MSLSLSRSSELYRFVFGTKSRWFVHGFPEPRSARISSGLFAGLFASMLFIRSFAAVMLVVFDVMLRLICFLADGSYIRGNIRTDFDIIPLEHWPTLFGRRLSPWIVIAVFVCGEQLYREGVKETLGTLLGFAVVAVLFCSKTDEKSPSIVLSEAIGPVVDDKLRTSYFSEPKLFPAIALVD